ncbi:DUF975 family protein [Listeria aquatica]|uniref:DUF975 family protein n=1 Tax=Listeria aquatica TaxID=1494960 RepID=UPI0031F4E768
MQSISELRRSARESLRGKWGLAIGVFILSYLIIAAGSSILGFIPILGWLASFLLIGPLTIGVSWFYLSLSRKERPDVGYMFSGYNDFGRTLLAYVLVSVFTMLWSLLLIVPGIIKMYSYSQTYYILRDNPDISALDAITESRHMMNGYKGKLFGLSLTFLLWYLIPVVIFIIGIAVMGTGALFRYVLLWREREHFHYFSWLDHWWKFYLTAWLPCFYRYFYFHLSLLPNSLRNLPR